MEILSLAALLAVIALSCFSKVNPGLIAIGLAWLIGHYGAHISINTIAAGFPTHMFIVLVGVTYLFGIAKHNGTLEKLVQYTLRLTRNNALTSPLLFFVIAFLLSTLGAGNIGTVALLAPIAMAVAWETGIGAFFMTIILICGANAGTFSPFALTGIIANGLVGKIGIEMNPWTEIFIPNLLAQSLLALFTYLIFFNKLKDGKKHASITLSTLHVSDPQWNKEQVTTIASIILLIIGGVFIKADIGFLSIVLASVLTLLNVSDGKEALKNMPWNIILMVCGINMLIGVLETLGGLVLLTDLLAKVSTPYTVIGVTAFITGIISAFSSSSGVVLPTFIPLVPELIEKVGGGNIVAVISSINVGAHLVDISPLSSLGALCLASALHEDKERLFKHLLSFGLSMTVAGIVICYILFGWMR